MAVTLNADSGGYTAGGYVNIQSPITTLGGALVIGGQSAPLTSAAVGNSTQAVGVKIGAGLTTTGGAITINGSGFVSSTSTAYGVYINNNAVNAGGGNVSITGIGGGNGSSSNNVGVFTSGGLGTVSTSGAGRISITGTGGNSSGAGNYGINQTAPITNTGTGAITLSGTGGGTGASEIGYLSNSNTTAGTGNISITGIASATATGSGTHGISFSGATISTTGAGSITLAGTATGTGAGANTDAVFVGAAGVITAAGGLISVTGHNNSTGTGGGNDGVYVTGGGSTIKSTGTGGVTVLGFGGGSGAGGSNYGVVWDVANGIQSTGGGAVSITGTGGDTGGSGAGNNGVNTAMALASAGGAINITGSAGTSSGINYGINIASVAAGAGVITLSSTSVNNAATALTGASLNLLGAGGVYALTNPGNAVTTLAGNTGAVTYSQLGALTIGTVGISAGLTATGTPWVTTGGALTIASGATVSGAAPILAATGAFINSSGSGAVVANSGRWLVYSANSTGDTFGNLNSNNAAVWNTPANGGVAPTGNRYVFANQPTATFTSVSLGKVYGVNDTAAVAASYTVTGLQSVTNAYTDTLATVTTGTASVTSAGSLATATVAGSPYAITAAAGTLASTNGYALAFASPGVLTVTAAPLTVTANAQTRPYGAANPTLTYVAAGLVNGDTLTGALATTATATSSVLGSPYAITQGTLAASPNYALTYVGNNLTVTAAPLTVTANNETKTYGATFAFAGTEFTPTGLQNGETIGSVTLTSAGSAPAASVAGSPYAIVASAAAGGTFTASNYAIGYVNGAMTVTPAGLTVTANAQTRPYGAANPTLTYVAAGLVNGDTLTGALATTATATSSVLGSPYAITQGTLAASPNYALTYVGNNLTVTAAPLTVTANNETKTYGATFAFAGTEFTPTGLQNGETIGSVTLTSAGSAPAASVAGSPYAIVASAAAGGTFTASNYAIGYVNGAMTVTPAGLTVTANAQTRPYGAANPTLTYVAAGLVNGDTLTGALATTATATSSVLGSPYAITQGTLAASPNYALTYVGNNLTVTAAPLTVTANNETKTYGATFAFAGTEFTPTGLQNGETIGSVTLTSAGSAPAASVAGSPYAIVASAAAGGTFTASNYAIGYVNGAMTVTPAGLTVTANAQTRPYGAANPTLTYVAAGLVNGDTLTGALATTATATSSVLGSPYAITQGTLAASPNYALTYVGNNLTVTAAPLTVTANNETKTYGATFAFAGTEFTPTGLQNGETIGSVTLTSAGSAPAASVAGSPYAIVASAAAGGTFTASNYAIGYVNGAMTVTPAGLTVTANAQTRPYGAANPTLTYVAAGLVNGDTLTGALATTATATSSVLGSPYAITQGTLAASPNYALTYVGNNLTVTAAPLTVTANNETKTYGATFAFAGTEFTPTGLQNGETIGSVTLTSAGSAPAASVAGSPYATVASAAAGGTFTASNYAIGYVNGAMTVTPAATDGDRQCTDAALWRGQPDADLCRDRPGQRRHADRGARHHGDCDLLGPRIALRHHPGDAGRLAELCAHLCRH